MNVIASCIFLRADGADDDNFAVTWPYPSGTDDPDEERYVERAECCSNCATFHK